MKKFQEFIIESELENHRIYRVKNEDSLLENELEDLRKDLLGLGFSRSEIQVEGRIIDEDYDLEFSGEGRGDSEEEAARMVVNAMCKMLFGRTKNKGVIEVEDGELKKWEELGVDPEVLVSKTLNRTLEPDDFLFTDGGHIDISIRSYEGLDSGGRVEFDLRGGDRYEGLY